MSKTLIIAIREFRQRLRARGFWLGSIGVPLVFLIIWAVSGGVGNTSVAAAPEMDLPDQVIGYVDQAGLIQTVPPAMPGDLFRALPDLPTAEAALARGDVGAYYIISPGYRETGQVQRISQRLTINPTDVRWFNRLLQANLLPKANPELLERLRRPFNAAGPEFVSVAAAQGQAGAGGTQMGPFLATIVIIMPLFAGAGYLFQSLAQEKTNRVMEILLVSLRPSQLMAGKLLGLGALTLLQYAIWVGLGLAGLLAAGQDVGQILAGIHLPARQLLLVVPFALGGFLLYAALMAGIGALARDVEDGRVWLFVISLPLMLPIYLGVTIAGAPNSVLAVGLSLFPFSAPAAMLLRITGAAVPTWQIALSLMLLALTGIGVVWLMARLFRAQTLLSGESFSVRRLWAALSN
ncbi:MAG: ABC transporter permease [Anaerolineae bacterium]|nr:ABC transporter permease [Anaerolineae bacterium]